MTPDLAFTSPATAPHTRADHSISRIMLTVAASLAPATLYGFWLYGWPSIFLWIITVLAALFGDLLATFARAFGRVVVLPGLALGLSRRETIRHVILPLALRRMLPPLGNQWIISIKDTSLFIVIGVAELTRQGQEIIAGNFRALEIWSAVAVFYLIITLVLSFILRRLERRMKIL